MMMKDMNGQYTGNQPLSSNQQQAIPQGFAAVNQYQSNNQILSGSQLPQYALQFQQGFNPAYQHSNTFNSNNYNNAHFNNFSQPQQGFFPAQIQPGFPQNPAVGFQQTNLPFQTNQGENFSPVFPVFNQNYPQSNSRLHQDQTNLPPSFFNGQGSFNQQYTNNNSIPMNRQYSYNNMAGMELEDNDFDFNQMRMLNLKRNLYGYNVSFSSHNQAF